MAQVQSDHELGGVSRQSRLARYFLPGDSDLVFMGGEMNPEWLIAAYTNGCFPWTGEDPIPWYNPDPRLVLLPEKLRLSRSMRRLIRHQPYRIVFDGDFREIMTQCATVPRPGQVGSWITPEMIEAYAGLFDQGIGHCVGVYRGTRLVGGLYGLGFGRAFFGESMFSHESNTSKLALWALCHFLMANRCDYIDCQQVTAHLVSMGAQPLIREQYMALLARTLRRPSLHHRWRWAWS